MVEYVGPIRTGRGELVTRGELFDESDEVRADLDVYLAPKDSPVFTGNPTSPTPVVQDNSSSIATTAYVIAAIGSTENIPPGTMIVCTESGGGYVRPTSRADIVVVFTGASDPGAVALENDRWERLT